MKAPEKLYLDATSKCGDTVFTIKNNDTDIEYTRTDAFIEKACEWLKNNIDSYNTTNEFEHWFDEMFEDFKHYMKGD